MCIDRRQSTQLCPYQMGYKNSVNSLLVFYSIRQFICDSLRNIGDKLDRIPNICLYVTELPRINSINLLALFKALSF